MMADRKLHRSMSATADVIRSQRRRDDDSSVFARPQRISTRTISPVSFDKKESSPSRREERRGSLQRSQTSAGLRRSSVASRQSSSISPRSDTSSSSRDRRRESMELLSSSSQSRVLLKKEQERIDMLERERIDMQLRIRELEDDLLRLRSGKSGDLVQENVKLKDLLQRHRKEVEEKNDLILKVRDQLTRLEHENEDLKRQVIDSQSIGIELAKKKEELKEVEMKVQDLRGQLRRKNEEAKEWAEKESKLASEIASLRSKESRRRDVEQQVSYRASESQGLHMLIEEKDRLLEIARKELESAVKEREKLQKRLEMLEPSSLSLSSHQRLSRMPPPISFPSIAQYTAPGTAGIGVRDPVIEEFWLRVDKVLRDDRDLQIAARGMRRQMEEIYALTQKYEMQIADMERHITESHTEKMENMEKKLQSAMKRVEEAEEELEQEREIRKELEIQHERDVETAREEVTLYLKSLEVEQADLVHSVASETVGRLQITVEEIRDMESKHRAEVDALQAEHLDELNTYQEKLQGVSDEMQVVVDDLGKKEKELAETDEIIRDVCTHLGVPLPSHVDLAQVKGLVISKASAWRQEKTQLLEGFQWVLDVGLVRLRKTMQAKFALYEGQIERIRKRILPLAVNLRAPMERKVDTLRSTVSELRRELEDSENRVRLLSDLREKMESELQDARKETLQLRDVSRENEERMRRLQENNRVLIMEVEEKRMLGKKVNAKFSKMKEENRRLRSELANLRDVGHAHADHAIRRLLGEIQTTVAQESRTLQSLMAELEDESSQSRQMVITRLEFIGKETTRLHDGIQSLLESIPEWRSSEMTTEIVRHTMSVRDLEQETKLLSRKANEIISLFNEKHDIRSDYLAKIRQTVQHVDRRLSQHVDELRGYLVDVSSAPESSYTSELFGKKGEESVPFSSKVGSSPNVPVSRSHVSPLKTDERTPARSAMASTLSASSTSGLVLSPASMRMMEELQEMRKRFRSIGKLAETAVGRSGVEHGSSVEPPGY
eukprot:TRINITY_DN2993_c0_g1_i1.p1 TRINITY_DN2993_c0_g1~~TRINITY_DN2993_c0_g1_i1.p1  ORF type:complete len:1010 (+),score=372.48 TRINITY_DN2993_c0_g1_i1:124-3153(+)